MKKIISLILVSILVTSCSFWKSDEINNDDTSIKVNKNWINIKSDEEIDKENTITKVKIEEEEKIEQNEIKKERPFLLGHITSVSNENYNKNTFLDKYSKESILVNDLNFYCHPWYADYGSFTEPDKQPNTLEEGYIGLPNIWDLIPKSIIDLSKATLYWEWDLKWEFFTYNKKLYYCYESLIELSWINIESLNFDFYDFYGNYYILDKNNVYSLMRTLDWPIFEKYIWLSSTEFKKKYKINTSH